MKCTECNGSGEAIYFVETDRDENTVTVKKRKCICRTCNGSGEMPMTNADRIRAMTDEELAQQLTQVFCEGFKASTTVTVPDELCHEIWAQFYEQLQQPAEGDA